LREESRRWDARLTRQTAVITAACTVAGALIGVALGIIGAILWVELTSADTTLARLVVGAFLGGGGGSLLAFMIGGPLAVKRIRKEHQPPGDREQSTEQSKEGW
jgi:flagellar motor component MotA